jgi:serine/threonine protein kinase
MNDPLPSPPPPSDPSNAPTLGRDGSSRSGKPASESRAPSQGAARTPANGIPGTTIGPYEVGEKLGEGGFGIVYQARQHHPVSRTVALKVIKAGMDTREVIDRFAAERQALALMDHPNIAKVLDAGATDSGRPYFVMELIPGPPITDYCDRRKLSPRERLALFSDVCLGVQHAHQKGVIHRDLKPSNVLVVEHDGEPVPKVIDFGVAKAVRSDPTSDDPFTLNGQLMGTPLYMSPEQAEAGEARVDTRADVYSLGVMLYELLTGRTPFSGERFKVAGFDGIRHILLSETPSKPSTLVNTLTSQDASEIASRRGVEPDRLSRLIRGDLDWIVMRALEKDPARRYQTAAALADDIRRHLDGLPVEASPPSTTYRVSRFVRRHRVAVSAATAIALSVLAGGGVSMWQAIRATRMQQALQQSLDESQQAIDRMRQAVNPAEAVPDEVVEGIAALERIESELAALETKLETHRARHGLIETQIDRTKTLREDLAKSLPSIAIVPPPAAAESGTRSPTTGIAIKEADPKQALATYEAAITQLDADRKHLAEEVQALAAARDQLRAARRQALGKLKRFAPPKP